MNNRERILQFVKKVHVRLISEHLFRVMQTALSFGLILGAIVFGISRLFVFPYFQLWALVVGAIGFVGLFVWGVMTRPSSASSLQKFDQYFPENILLTALHVHGDESGLLESLREKTAQTVNLSFNLFKLRQKHLWRVKSLIGIGAAIILLLVLIAFPSTTQLLAKDIEMEKEVVEKMKKEVAKTIKKTSPAKLKKELQQLEKDLAKTETTEEALRELVKKQKELQLREQKLVDKQQAANKSGNGKNGLTASEKEELAALKAATKDLADQAGKTQTALSKLGKTSGNSNETALGQANPSNSTQNNDPTDSQGTSQGQPSSSNQTPSSQSPGQGQQGQGQGQGQSAGGLQGGQGSGSRDLLSVPSRLGGASDSTVDSGKIGEGSSAEEQESAVPVTKGTVRPYGDVIGSYKDSYLKSSERLQLPPDLQRIVQDYFSSIETSE
ncbi:MAG TPA: hypothetical protein VLQ66_06355 [Paenisporosarcina sp.]|nr:hypothetical protein [Paenisporosarcina sp.]